jgi:hypothetical protein
MDASEPTRRRWRSHEWNVLLVIALIAAFGLGWLAWQAQIVRHRRAMRAQIEAGGATVIGSYWTGGGAPFVSIEQVRAGDPDYRVSEIRRLLGDAPVWWIVLRPGVSGSDVREIQAFPEAEVWTSGVSPPPP